MRRVVLGIMNARRKAKTIEGNDDTGLDSCQIKVDY